MRTAVLIDDGYQDAEVLYPYYRLQEAGLDVDLVGGEKGAAVRGKYGYTLTADVAADKAKAKHYDALVVPGGWAPDHMRLHTPFVRLVQDMMADDKPLAAICHAGQLLVEADVVRGRHLTSYAAVRRDLENAGATWSDDAVVIDRNLITSRKPDDLPAFCAALLARLQQA